MLSALALSFVLSGQTPSPPTPSNVEQADLVCASFAAVALGLVGQDPDQARQVDGVRQVSTVLMYYLGRLEVRDPAADWPSRIEATVRERGWDGLRSDGERCSDEIAATGALIPAIGQGVIRATSGSPPAPTTE